MIRLRVKGTFGQYKRTPGGYACLNHLIHCTSNRATVVDRPEEARKPIARIGFARRTPDLVCHLLATFAALLRWCVFLRMLSAGRQQSRISACSVGFLCVHKGTLSCKNEQDNRQDS